MSLGLAILVIGLLYLLIVSERFRRFAAVCLGILVVGTFLLFAWFHENKRAAEHKRELAKTYIKVGEVELVEPRVKFSSYDGRPERITGRVKNNSGYGLAGLDLRLVFQDCLSTGHCETVGDDKKEIFVSVPPGQSRDFDEYISGPILAPRGKIQWTYQVLSVSARVE